NVYAAALWGADVAFQLASVGAVGINFHTPGNHYGVFTASGGSVTVQPLYYGMRLFSIAVPAGAVVVPARVDPFIDTLHAWAAIVETPEVDQGTIAISLPALDAVVVTFR